MTAPDPQCGLVFVRGDFPDISDSILARAQRRNGRGTFGMSVKVPNPAEPGGGWVQEATPVQGMINLRWPCTRLHWVRNSTGIGGEHFASFVVCTFVKDNTVYQIGRVVPIQLTRSASGTNSIDTNREATDDKEEHPVTFKVDVGGSIRFGCPSTAARQDHSASSKARDHYTCDPEYEHSSYVLSCISELHEKRLEMRLWINRKPQKIKRHKCEQTEPGPGCRPDDRPPPVASLHAFSTQKTLHLDRATVIVASFALVDRDNPVNKDPTKVIHYEEVQRYLGVADSTGLASYRLWSAMLESSSGPDTFELNTIGRAVEVVMGVASLPVPHGLRRAKTLPRFYEPIIHTKQLTGQASCQGSGAHEASPHTDPE